MSRNADEQPKKDALSCVDCERGLPHHLPPDLGADHFTCPRCGSHAWQTHLDLYGMPAASPGERPSSTKRVDGFALTQCNRCRKYVLWHTDNPNYPIYPSRTLLPPPVLNMPEHIAREYEEACSVFASSVRACVALLGLVIEKLWREASIFDPDARSALLELEQHSLVSSSGSPHVIKVQPGVIRRRDQDGDDLHAAQLLCQMINEFVEKSSRQSGAPD